MPDATLLWGSDLVPSPTGDVALSSDDALGQQRVLRRLLTNQGDYLWQPNYGAGLGQFIGTTANSGEIKAKIRSQIFLESTVARLPEPTINVVSAADGSIYVQVSYADAATGSSQVLSFSVSA